MKNIIALLIVSLLLFSACKDDFFDQVINVDIPEHTPSLSITSNLSNVDTILWVYVSSSIGILENGDPESITDAKVDLYKNGTLFQNLPFQEEGFYTTQLPQPLGNEDAEYELRVASTGFEPVSASQKMPAQIDISAATFDADGTINEDGDRVDEVIVTFQDKKDEANYYKVDANITYIENNGESYSYPITFNSTDPSIIEGDDGLYLSDAFLDGEKYELRLWNYEIYNDAYMNDAKIFIRLVNVSPEKYYWETSLRNAQNAEDNPFAEPAVIFSNIENGYGIFSLESVGPDFIIVL
ncbi:MAG: hypothetical protein ACI8P3_003161 [Saprospiraceae bacterium]|jgi:hypothetical protein